MKCLCNLTDYSLYVDDICICYHSKNMGTIERQLQQNLNKIENLATNNGFKFSNTVCTFLSVAILVYIYMDHLFKLLRNLNSLALFLLENSVLYTILNI